jgi:hypothetical protein
MAVTLTKEQAPLQADYDERGDVLYISLGNPRDAESESHERGVLLRFAVDSDEHVGVTVIGFSRNRWKTDVPSLARIVAEHLGTTPALAAEAINSVLAR